MPGLYQWSCKYWACPLFLSNTALFWRPSPLRAFLSSRSCWGFRNTVTTTSTSWTPSRRSFCCCIKVSSSDSSAPEELQYTAPNPDPLLSERREWRGHPEVVHRSPSSQRERLLPGADEEVCGVAEERRRGWVSQINLMLSTTHVPLYSSVARISDVRLSCVSESESEEETDWDWSRFFILE